MKSFNTRFRPLSRNIGLYQVEVSIMGIVLIVTVPSRGR